MIDFLLRQYTMTVLKVWHIIQKYHANGSSLMSFTKFSVTQDFHHPFLINSHLDLVLSLGPNVVVEFHDSLCEKWLHNRYVNIYFSLVWLFGFLHLLDNFFRVPRLCFLTLVNCRGWKKLVQWLGTATILPFNSRTKFVTFSTFSTFSWPLKTTDISSHGFWSTFMSFLLFWPNGMRMWFRRSIVVLKFAFWFGVFLIWNSEGKKNFGWHNFPSP